jgi:hypothetical protein
MSVPLAKSPFPKRVEEPISTLAGLGTVLGSQRNPDPFHGVVGPVKGEMAPPGASVVPEMVIVVMREDANGKRFATWRGSLISHGAEFFGRSPRQRFGVQ